MGSTPTFGTGLTRKPHSSSGPGRRPLKAVTRVRIPYAAWNVIGRQFQENKALDGFQGGAPTGLPNPAVLALDLAIQGEQI